MRRKIVIIHVYEEEGDSKHLKEFQDLAKPHEEKDFQEALKRLCGTNEQKYDRANGYT